MNMNEQLDFLINFLLDEMPEYKRDAARITDKKILLRALMNVRLPNKKLDEEFLRVQDEYLSHERGARGVIDAEILPEILPGISLWQGDVTTLKADAIVNAANSALLGCFVPLHRCIDNAIHSASGLQLREECYEIMKAQNHPEPTGQAKITQGYNLPAKFVIHTVGPIITGDLTQRDRELLKSCYISCLKLAEKNNLSSIAFCCISTGEFHFPNDEAAKIAVETVKNFMSDSNSVKKVVFNVFKDLDFELYRGELQE